MAITQSRRIASLEDGPGVLLAKVESEQRRNMATYPSVRGQLLMVTEGSVRVQVAKCLWLVSRSQAIWLPSGMEHSWRSDYSYSGWAGCISKTLCDDLPARSHVMQIDEGLSDSLVGHLVNGIGEEIPKRLQGWLRSEISHSRRVGICVPLPKSPRLMKIARGVMRYPGRRWSLHDWASWTGVPRQHVANRFFEETNLSFLAWRDRLARLVAMEYITNGMNVQEACSLLGYRNPSDLAILLRKDLGCC